MPAAQPRRLGMTKGPTAHGAAGGVARCSAWNGRQVAELGPGPRRKVGDKIMGSGARHLRNTRWPITAGRFARLNMNFQEAATLPVALHHANAVSQRRAAAGADRADSGRELRRGLMAMQIAKYKGAKL